MNDTAELKLLAEVRAAEARGDIDAANRYWEAFVRHLGGQMKPPVPWVLPKPDATP